MVILFYISVVYCFISVFDVHVPVFKLINIHMKKDHICDILYIPVFPICIYE